MVMFMAQADTNTNSGKKGDNGRSGRTGDNINP